MGLLHEEGFVQDHGVGLPVENVTANLGIDSWAGYVGKVVGFLDNMVESLVKDDFTVDKVGEEPVVEALQVGIVLHVAQHLSAADLDVRVNQVCSQLVAWFLQLHLREVQFGSA